MINTNSQGNEMNNERELWAIETTNNNTGEKTLNTRNSDGALITFISKSLAESKIKCGLMIDGYCSMFTSTPVKI